MTTSILGGIPLALWELGLGTAKRGREERQKQEKLRQRTIEMEKSVREGTAGEATRRLLGIKDPPPTARQRPSPDEKKSIDPQEKGSGKRGTEANQRRE